MVKMLLTNCCLRLWIYLCCVFLVSSAETVIETDMVNPAPITSSQAASTVFEPAIQQSNNLPKLSNTHPYDTTLEEENFDVPQTLETRSIEMPYFSAHTPSIEQQRFPTSPIYSFPNSGNPTQPKPLTAAFNPNLRASSPTPTFAQILAVLTRNSPFEAFAFLLRPLDSYSLPPSLLSVQSNILRLIRLNFLRVREILDYLQRYSHLKEVDLAIMGLLFLAQSLPRYCELRNDINELSTAISLLRLIEQLPTMSQQHPQCKQKVVTVEIPGKCVCPPPAAQPGTNNLLISIHNSKKVTETTIKETLISALTVPFTSPMTVPLTAQMQHAYNVTKSFIESSENQEILKLLISNNTQNINQQQLLSQFYTIFKKTTTVSVEVKEEILKYMEFVLGQYAPVTPTPEVRFDYAVLLEILPTPADSTEQQYINSLTIALKTEEAYTILKKLGIENISDQKHQLIEVLKALQLQHSSPQVRESAKYYLDYLEKLESLTLIGTKKIEKRFDLTGIFSDTLQLGLLPSSAKIAFKKIYKYIANMHGTEMENFNEWNEATTRAQFTQFLFNYFLAQGFVPADIKAAITILIPYIRKDGKGALPP